MTEADRAEVWQRYGDGASAAMIGRAMGWAGPTVAEFIRKAGGIRPKTRCVSPARLSLDDREEISRGVAAGESVRCIARRLGRAPSTISREINRNGGPRQYRALRAEQAARQRAKRPKPARLAADPLLRMLVADKLARDGRLSRSQGGWPVSSPADPRCRCRTRRSTGRCSCSPAASCAAN